MHDRSDASGALGTPPRRTLSLRSVVVRTYVPAVVGSVLSLVVLAVVALVLSVSVRPHLSQLRQAATAAGQAHDAMLDEETGVRGYLATGEKEFLQPYLSGQALRTAADGELVTAVGGQPGLLRDAVSVVQSQQAWQDQWATPSTDGSWNPLSRGGGAAGATSLAAHLTEGKALFDSYRAVDAHLQSALADEVASAEGSYQRALLAAVLALAVIGIVSLLGLVRGSRRLQRQVVAPVRDLTATVGQVARGDLSPRPGVPSIVDEVAALSHDVAGMTTALADRMKLAADREDALVRHGARLELVLELSRGLSESLSLRYTSLHLLSAVRRLAGAERSDLWLRSQDRDELVRYDVAGADDRTPAADSDADAGSAEPIDVGIGAIGRAARYGRAISLDESRDSQAEDSGAGGVAIPLVVGSQVIGVLALTPPAGGTLDLELIDALIMQGASALQAAQLHSDVEEQSRRDSLTGLANRRQFDEDLSENVARAARYARQLSLVMIDLDHFKQINDTYGHQRGDEVLQDVAGIVVRGIRSVDTAYRYGGEELCVLMPETGSDDACQIAERLRAQVEASFPWARRSPITLSAGVAELGHDAEGPALIGAADRALYAAKRNGRNRVECELDASSGT
ncbi:MAG: diguanylate cyclase [Nocardioides sp.]